MIPILVCHNKASWSCFNCLGMHFFCLSMVTYDKVSYSKFLDVRDFFLFAMQPVGHTNSSFLEEYLVLSFKGV